MDIATAYDDSVSGIWQNYIVSGSHPTITFDSTNSSTRYTDALEQQVFDSLSKQHFGGLSIEALQDIVKQHYPELFL